MCNTQKLKDFLVCIMFTFRGRKIYEPPRFMTVEQAAHQLREAITKRAEERQEGTERSSE